WFEIPADDVERAKKFYGDLFGWKINPFPGGGDYWHIDTGGADESPDGALKGRNLGRNRSRTTSAWIRSLNSPKKLRSSVEKSPWQKRPCRRWAILRSVRTLRVTHSAFGKATRQLPENNCPKLACSFVVILKARKQS